MPRLRFPSVARRLQNEVPDADLLERYVHQNSDDAFGQLVARYSRLVWGQCRNSLANDADADDAFQAAFLTLARSAKTLKPDIPLGPWLHGVAFRVCKNARRAMARRSKRERASARPESNRPVADSAWEIAFAAVAEEVQKLPAAQRVAFVLCCIEGRATTDAAESLGQKLGTFSARLTRAKQTLLGRLAKRGIGASVLALGGVTGSVSVAPAALIARTLAWLPSGVAVPSSIQVLTYGVTGMMLLRFKVLAAGVLVATGLGLSVGGGWSGTVVAQVPGDAAPGATAPGAATKSKKAAEKAELNLESLKEQLTQFKKQQAETIAELRKRLALDLTVEAGDFDLTVEAGNLDLGEDLAVAPKVKAPKFEYEPVPSSHEEFETKLGVREKAGWAFVGEVTFRAGEKMVPTLVFRKKSAADVRVFGPTSMSWAKDGKGFNPVMPVVPFPPAGFAPLAPVAPLAPGSALPTPPAAPAKPKVFSGSVELLPKLDAELQAKIAALEKELKVLKASKVLEPRTFTQKDYGNWVTAELTDVLGVLIGREVTAGKYKTDQCVFNLGTDGFTFLGSAQATDSVAEWVKKLKK